MLIKSCVSCYEFQVNIFVVLMTQLSWAKNLMKKTKRNRSNRPETLAQVFSCEFCKIFKNTFFHGTLLVAASVVFGKYWKPFISTSPHYHLPCQENVFPCLMVSLSEPIIKVQICTCLKVGQCTVSCQPRGISGKES